MTTYETLECLLSACPLPFVGLFSESDITSDFGAYNHDFCAIFWQNFHWILLGKFKNKPFLLDSGKFQKSQTCAMYCVLFAYMLPYLGEVEAERLFVALQQVDSDSHLAANDLLLIETLCDAFSTLYG